MAAVETNSYIICIHHTTYNTLFEKALSNANNIIYVVTICMFYFLLKDFCLKNYQIHLYKGRCTTTHIRFVFYKMI